MEKLDFPMKNLRVSEKEEFLQKGLEQPARERETSFLTGIPTYRKARAVLLLKE